VSVGALRKPPQAQVRVKVGEGESLYRADGYHQDGDF